MNSHHSAFGDRNPALIADSVSVSIRGRTIFDGVEFALHRGDVLAIRGRSGSGKTTLLSCLGGLRTPTTGSISFMGHDLVSLSRSRRARIRLESIGFVFQHADLLPELTPLENVMLPALLAGMGTPEARARAEELLAELGVRTSAGTSALSGGEAQRLALARALISEPTLLLADEPTGSLDGSTRDEVLAVMLSLVRSRNMAAAIATHDPYVASQAQLTITLAAEAHAG